MSPDDNVVGSDPVESDEEVGSAEIVEIAGKPVRGDDPAAPEGAVIALPEDPDEAIRVLIDAVGIAQQAADRYLDDLRRLAAEYENYRKRVQRDREELINRSAQRVVEALLPVLDSFDQAFAHEAQTPGEEQLLSGVRGTFHQLMDVLGKEGLTPVPGLGEPFDPNVHEAVMGGGDGDLVVAQELRRGYIHNGRLLRAALVAVESTDTEKGEPPA